MLRQTIVGVGQYRLLPMHELSKSPWFQTIQRGVVGMEIHLRRLRLMQHFRTHPYLRPINGLIPPQEAVPYHRAIVIPPHLDRLLLTSINLIITMSFSPDHQRT